MKEENCLGVEETEALAGKFLNDDAFNLLLGGPGGQDYDVYKPDGSLLLKYRRGLLSPGSCYAAWNVLRHAALPSLNRGIAAGGDRNEYVKKDGTKSNTVLANPVNSGIVGFYDRYVRTPYCRMTAFTEKHMREFQEAIPLVAEVSEAMRLLVPERWAAQREMIDKTHPDFFIRGTVFTTLTVNKNWQTAVHTDSGDLKEGFGCLLALRAGRFRGGFTVIPRFKVAVDLQTTDLLLYDVHEWHGNTPLIGLKGGFERISVVLYYRKNMAACGSMEEELARAQRRAAGDPLL